MVRGAAFDADSNSDGVKNGLAWMLGATNPSQSALALLPEGQKEVGGFVLRFNMLNSSNRGNAVLRLQHGSNLGNGEQWTSIAIPDTTSTVGDVGFVITPAGGVNEVVATIPLDPSPAGRKFARLLLETPNP